MRERVQGGHWLLCGRMNSRSINSSYVCGPSSLSTPLIAMMQPSPLYNSHPIYGQIG